MLLASGIASLLPVLFALACPLMMIFMMRGMHGGRGAGHAGGRHGGHSDKSLDELKAERDELNEEIGRGAEQGVAR